MVLTLDEFEKIISRYANENITLSQLEREHGLKNKFITKKIYDLKNRITLNPKQKDRICKLFDLKSKLNEINSTYNSNQLKEESITEDKLEQKWVSKSKVNIKDAYDIFNIDKNEYEIKSVNCKSYEGFIKNKNKEVEKVDLFSIHVKADKITNNNINQDEILNLLKTNLIPTNTNKKNRPKKSTDNNGNLLYINISDAHLNKLYLEDESIVENKFIYAIDQFLNRAYKFENINKILLVIGNDFFNIDSNLNSTTKGTHQTTKVSYNKMVVDGINLTVNTINKCLEYADVDVITIPGNHDRNSMFWLSMVLKHHFNEFKSVTINPLCSNINKDTRRYYKWGKSLFGFTHGDIKSVPLKDIMQVDVPLLWAQSKYREYHTGHLHSRNVKENKIFSSTGTTQEEFNGIVVRRISSLSDTDYWHYQQGYIGAIIQGVAFIVSENNHIIAELPVSF